MVFCFCCSTAKQIDDMLGWVAFYLINSWPDPKSCGKYNKAWACLAFCLRVSIVSCATLAKYSAGSGRDKCCIVGVELVWKSYPSGTWYFSFWEQIDGLFLHFCLCFPPSSPSPFSFLPSHQLSLKTYLRNYEIQQVSSDFYLHLEYRIHCWRESYLIISCKYSTMLFCKFLVQI